MTWILACYGLMSAAAFAAYWLDKRRAGRGEWRISERTLHAIELLGGWPGAWLAQRVYRHKWRQKQYMVVFLGNWRAARGRMGVVVRSVRLTGSQ